MHTGNLILNLSTTQTMIEWEYEEDRFINFQISRINGKILINIVRANPVTGRPARWIVGELITSGTYAGTLDIDHRRSCFAYDSKEAILTRQFVAAVWRSDYDYMTILCVPDEVMRPSYKDTLME